MEGWQMNTDFPLLTHEGATVRLDQLIAQHPGVMLLPFRGRW